MIRVGNLIKVDKKKNKLQIITTKGKVNKIYSLLFIIIIQYYLFNFANNVSIVQYVFSMSPDARDDACKEIKIASRVLSNRKVTLSLLNSIFLVIVMFSSFFTVCTLSIYLFLFSLYCLF